jgi:hypothetical protein
MARNPKRKKAARSISSRSKKRVAGKKSLSKRAVAKKKSAKKTLKQKGVKPSRSAARKKSISRENLDVSSYPLASPRESHIEDAGDLQGLSRSEVSESESVDELLDEGNAFEAEAVEGVEDAEARSERGVHTREVPEDDVPGEYLDKE